MFLFFEISPIVIIVIAALIIMNTHIAISAGAIVAMVAILAGAFTLTALGIAYLRYRHTQPRLSAGYEPAQSRLTARAVVTPDGIMEQQAPPVWPSQPRLSLAVPLDDEQLQAAAVYILENYRQRASLADLEAIDEGRTDTHG